jgi:hypothetical protein
VLLLVVVVRMHPQRDAPAPRVLAGVTVVLDHAARCRGRRQHHRFEQVVRRGEQLRRHEDGHRLAWRSIPVVAQCDLDRARRPDRLQVIGDARGRGSDRCRLGLLLLPNERLDLPRQGDRATGLLQRIPVPLLGPCNSDAAEPADELDPPVERDVAAARVVRSEHRTVEGEPTLLDLLPQARALDKREARVCVALKCALADLEVHDAELFEGVAFGEIRPQVVEADEEVGDGEQRLRCSSSSSIARSFATASERSVGSTHGPSNDADGSGVHSGTSLPRRSGTGGVARAAATMSSQRRFRRGSRVETRRSLRWKRRRPSGLHRACAP